MIKNKLTLIDLELDELLKLGNSICIRNKMKLKSNTFDLIESSVIGAIWKYEATNMSELELAGTILFRLLHSHHLVDGNKRMAMLVVNRILNHFKFLFNWDKSTLISMVRDNWNEEKIIVYLAKGVFSLSNHNANVLKRLELN